MTLIKILLNSTISLLGSILHLSEKILNGLASLLNSIINGLIDPWREDAFAHIHTYTDTEKPSGTVLQDSMNQTSPKNDAILRASYIEKTKKEILSLKDNIYPLGVYFQWGTDPQAYS